MVELKPIFKKAYWSLAAGGLLYVLCLLSLTFPEVQRLYVSRTYTQSELTLITQCSLCQQDQP